MPLHVLLVQEHLLGQVLDVQSLLCFEPNWRPDSLVGKLLVGLSSRSMLVLPLACVFPRQGCFPVKPIAVVWRWLHSLAGKLLVGLPSRVLVRQGGGKVAGLSNAIGVL